MSESGSGEPSSSSTDVDKGSSVECPTCEKNGFANPMGMRSHHKQAHGESIAKGRELDEVECDNCGVLFEKDPWKIEKNTYNYCSRDCKHDHSDLGDLIGDLQRERVEKECEICDSEFEVIPFRDDTAKYCSRECRVEGTKGITGEERYNYKSRTYECGECGEDVERSPSMVYSDNRVFCNHGCYSKSKRTGHLEYYGPNWEEQRKRARVKYQSRCQACGDTPCDTGRQLSVHHIKRIKWFKDNYDEPEWYEKGNKLSNLVPLCQSCHMEWEGIPVKPSFVPDSSA